MPILALILGLALGLSHAAQARTFDDIVASGFIRIGVYQNFPPFSYEENGVPKGIDIDIGTAIAEDLGVEPEFYWVVPDETLEDDLRNTIWKGHFLSERNEAGRAEVADIMLRVPYDRKLSLMRNEVGELKYELVHFFGPYQQESWQALYDSQEMASLRTVAMFQYHPVGVEVDSLPSTYLASALGGVMRENATHFPSVQDAYQAMVRGDVSAVIGMRSEIDSLQTNNPNDRFRLAENAFPGMGKQVWDIGMAVHDDNRQMGYAVGDVVRALILSGGMEKLFANHGVRYSQPSYYADIAQSD